MKAQFERFEKSKNMNLPKLKKNATRKVTSSGKTGQYSTKYIQAVNNNGTVISRT